MKGAGVTWNIRGTRGTGEAGEPVFWAGDRVAGSVSLWPEHDLGCRGIDLQLCYRTGGRGSPESIEVITERIWTGPVTQGQSVESRFDLLLPPDGPVSYQGKLFHLEWLVRLRLDIPLWKDPADLFPITVRPRYSA